MGIGRVRDAAGEVLLSIFFSNAPATTEIYTLSLHDALPIWRRDALEPPGPLPARRRAPAGQLPAADRKSTRLNSSHPSISYAVFCLKKKIDHRNHLAA